MQQKIELEVCTDGNPRFNLTIISVYQNRTNLIVIAEFTDSESPKGIRAGNSQYRLFKDTVEVETNSPKEIPVKFIVLDKVTNHHGACCWATPFEHSINSFTLWNAHCIYGKEMQKNTWCTTDNLKLAAITVGLFGVTAVITKICDEMDPTQQFTPRNP